MLLVPEGQSQKPYVAIIKVFPFPMKMQNFLGNCTQGYDMKWV